MDRILTNAKEEFLAANHSRLLHLECVQIAYHPNSLWEMYEENKGNVPQSKEIILKVGFTKEDLNNFLEELNFNYDAGYGGQELFGTIWYKDGTWAERGEYDGSEWWSLCRRPLIPTKLTNQ
jgi:hypothetical protein